MKDLTQYYLSLGRKTFNALAKVRGDIGDIEKWEVFAAAKTWEAIKVSYKMSEPEQAAFQKGWEQAFKRKYPLGKISNSVAEFEKSLRTPKARIYGH